MNRGLFLESKRGWEESGELEREHVFHESLKALTNYMTEKLTTKYHV